MRYLALIIIVLITQIDAQPIRSAGVSPPNKPQSALEIRVASGGIQRITGASLLAAGLNLSGVAPRQLVVRCAGVAVPIERRDGGDGQLDPADELRFYAPPPGDRWNRVAVCWLRVEPVPGPAMVVRSVAAGSAPERLAATERGEIYLPTIYDSRRAGPDSDHWFNADLRVGESGAMDLTLQPHLPAAPGPASFQIRGSALTTNGMRVTLSAGSQQSAGTISVGGDWALNLGLTTSKQTLRLELSALIGPTGEPLAAGSLIDRVGWERPALLRFGGKGAIFSGVAGIWRYQMAELPAGWSIYDIGEPNAPQLLDTAGATGFVDGPAPGDYLIAGPDTLHSPQLSAYQGPDLAAPQAADVVYIVPDELRAGLEPLLTQRRAQGYHAVAISVEAIYAHWSYGAVDPEAIRSFLRYAATTWSHAPDTVVLVGDGSADPFDHTERGALNRNLIPPYMAPVDPWLGETACDTCYARLQSDDPRDEELPDLRLGRLPVKSAAELASLIAKLISYENAAPGGVWRAKAAMIADDSDTAGNFANLSDAVIADLPKGMLIRRTYYDPSGAQGISDATQARERALATFNEGAALLIYQGHSHQWQWAFTDPSANPSALLSLYDPDAIQNQGRLPVVLAMTCLSSAFQTPARSGTTVDERLLLAPGGAVAVWGPAGFGVIHGHDALIRGFIRRLGPPPANVTIGELTTAGYRELAAAGGARDTLFTYVLLGDPLTRLRTIAAEEVFLPLVR